MPRRCRAAVPPIMRERGHSIQGTCRVVRCKPNYLWTTGTSSTDASAWPEVPAQRPSGGTHPWGDTPLGGHTARALPAAVGPPRQRRAVGAGVEVGVRQHSAAGRLDAHRQPVRHQRGCVEPVPARRRFGASRRSLSSGGSEGSGGVTAARSAYGLGRETRKSYSGSMSRSGAGFFVGISLKRRCSPRTDDSDPPSIDEDDHKKSTR